MFWSVCSVFVVLAPPVTGLESVSITPQASVRRVQKMDATDPSEPIRHYHQSGKAECEHNRSKAISNYRRGKGAIWFYHITHNAGTTWRGMASHNGLEETKSSVKNGLNAFGRDKWTYNPSWFQSPPRGKTFVFPQEERALPPPDPQSELSSMSPVVPCASDVWVSVITMRDPIIRILSGDGLWTTNATENLDTCNTDNYALRMLIGKPFDAPLIEDDMALAKRRLDSFDFVLDVGDFSASMQLMCTELGWIDCSVKTKDHKDPKSILPPAVYQKFLSRNRHDLELYEYSKKLSRRLVLKALGAAKPNVALTETDLADLTESESGLKWTCPKDACGSCAKEAKLS